MPMNKNSAVQMLLDKINDLTRRVEILESRLHPTFTNSISNTGALTYSNHTIGATPTVTRAEMTAYGQSMADVWNDRFDEIQRQLNDLNTSRIPTNADVEPMTFEVRDGNIYINGVNENATDENQ